MNSLPIRPRKARSRPRLASTLLAAPFAVTLCTLGGIPARAQAPAQTAPAPAPAAAPTPLELGRQYTTWFYAGDTDRVWQQFALEMKRALPTADKLREFREEALKQLGVEERVVDERVRPADSFVAYERTVKFSRTNVPMQVQFTVRADGKIVGFLIRPLQKEADSRFLDYQTKTPLHLPFTGDWRVAWGGRTLAENAHAFTPDQRFAYDFVVVEEGSTHRGDGSSNDQYYCFGKPILAPAPGVVAAAADGTPENHPGSLDPSHPFGNYVVIDHGGGEFSFLAHLQTGSVAVKKGDIVKAGAVVGRCGNTGNASEPHLHYHLQTSPTPFGGEGLPAQFRDYSANGKPVSRGEPVKGQLIRATGAAASSSSSRRRAASAATTPAGR